MSISTKDEWAFPCPAGTSPDNGMTLRDYFAAKAMQAMLSSPNCPMQVEESKLASHAYKVADAMLEARNK